MRTTRARAVLAALLLSLAAGGVAAIDVEHAAKEGVDFDAYKTWGWKDRPGEELALGGDPDLERRILEAAEKTLAANGLERAPAGAADLWLTVTGFAEDELQIEGVRLEITRHVAWVGDHDSHSVRSHQRGTLVIELLDSASGQIVWSGWASGVAKTPERLRKKAVQATTRILRHFPPR